MKKILVIGAIRKEILSHVTSLPKGNEDIESLDVVEKIGGGAYYTGLLSEKLKLPYTLLSCVGTGANGEEIRNRLDEEGISYFESEEIHGSFYQLVDQKGNTGSFVVDGCEYDFLMDELQYLDTDEYNSVILFSEMLNEDSADDILYALEELQLPVYFVLNEDGYELDQAITEALYALEPVVILHENDHIYASSVKEKTGRDVILVKKDGIGYYGSEDFEAFPYENNCNMDLFAASFVLACNLGLLMKDAVEFAILADKETKQGERMDAFTMDLLRNRLADMIKGKDYGKEIRTAVDA